MALYKFTYLLNCKIAVILMLCDYVCVCVWSLYVAALLLEISAEINAVDMLSSWN